MSIIRCEHKGQHIYEWMEEMEEVCYGNSFGHFVPAFIGEGKVSKDELKISCNE